MARRVVTHARGPKRQTLWLGWATVETTLAGAPSVAITNSLNAAALALRPFTIIRFRGIIHVNSDQLAANEIFGMSFGAAVVSDQSVAIGVTAVPTPTTDQGSGLFFTYEQVFGRHLVGSGAGTGVPLEAGVRRYFDSKAMRKVDLGQDVITTVENEISGCVVVTSGRMLIKTN